MMSKIIAGVGLVSTAAFLFFINTTSPNDIGPLGILAVFLTFYLMIFAMLVFIFWQGSRAIVRVSKVFAPRKPLIRMSLLRATYLASSLGLIPVMLVAMQSIGGVGFYELLLVAVFALVAIVYILKRTP